MRSATGGSAGFIKYVESTRKKAGLRYRMMAYNRKREDRRQGHPRGRPGAQAAALTAVLTRWRVRI
jgi:hypothetical protein